MKKDVFNTRIDVTNNLVIAAGVIGCWLPVIAVSVVILVFI